MTLSYSPEHESLRASVRRLLSERAGSERLRASLASADAYDQSLWKTLAEELGLHGLALPEEYGGSGFGLMEQAVVLEEMGRVVHCSPYFSSVVLAATALQLAGDAGSCRRWLPGIASGELVGTVAVLDADGRWGGEVGVRIGESDGARALNGEAHFVTDAGAADVVVVLATDGQERCLAVAECDQQGVVADDQPVLDTTRPLGTLRFDNARADVIATGDDVDRALVELRDVAIAALAAEQVGGAAKALEMAVEYAKIRQQFGRPIGSFQAIKFKAADMLVQLEAARSASLYATAAVASRADDRAVAAAVAKAVCSEAYFAIAAESIQIHGGIGFTWEHDAHFYFKRAKASELLFGSPDEHRARLADQLGW